MTQKSAKPEKMSWLIPYLIASDAGATAHFYQHNFGFEILSTAKDDAGKIFHAELRYKDIVIMCGNAGVDGDTAKPPLQGHFVSPVTLYFYHDDVDALYDFLQNNNVGVDAPPTNEFWGDRVINLKDLDGHRLCFATHVADHP
ncbi:VOC family protein [Legionella sp. 27cVA30]|uniref:VOC family protein n=1 Tax=Legionella sp. 27cVA30 TaxID=2905657 RepID=UPI0020A034AC|nr:VOC family protein [Legionella sp. 27cVA30]MCP0914752.1 VOC family protein [Legionella sp. 27cVA30]